MKRNIFEGILVLCIVCLFSGCGSSGTNLAASGTLGDKGFGPIPTLTLDASRLVTPFPSNVGNGGSPNKLDTPDLRNPPLYPGAMNVQTDYYETFGPISKTSFDTSDSEQQVFSYYMEHLPKLGWTFLKEFPSTYLWTNSTTEAPFKFSLDISFEILTTTQTRIHVVVVRWPDATKIPLYPGAENVQVAWQNEEVSSGKAQPSSGLWSRITKFKVGAKPEQISEFYRSHLSGPDWKFKNQSNTGSSNDIEFSYIGDNSTRYNSDSHEYRGGGVLITATVEGGEQTQVEIKVTATDIEPSTSEATPPGG